MDLTCAFSRTLHRGNFICRKPCQAIYHRRSPLHQLISKPRITSRYDTTLQYLAIKVSRLDATSEAARLRITELVVAVWEGESDMLLPGLRTPDLHRTWIWGLNIARVQGSSR